MEELIEEAKKGSKDAFTNFKLMGNAHIIKGDNQ